MYRGPTHTTTPRIPSLAGHGPSHPTNFPTTALHGGGVIGCLARCHTARMRTAQAPAACGGHALRHGSPGREGWDSAPTPPRRQGHGLMHGHSTSVVSQHSGAVIPEIVRKTWSEC